MLDPAGVDLALFTLVGAGSRTVRGRAVGSMGPVHSSGPLPEGVGIAEE
jgi:hypothetical protein